MAEVDTLIPVRESKEMDVEAFEKFLIENFKGTVWYHPTWLQDDEDPEGGHYMKFIKTDNPEMAVELAQLQTMVQ